MSTTTIGDIVRGDAEVFPPYLYEAYRSTIRRAPTLRAHRGAAHALGAHRARAPRSAPSRRRTPTSRATPAPAARRSASASSSPGACSTRPARRCRTRWSRCGRPTRPGATSIAAISGPRPLDPNFLGIGRCHTNDAGEYRFLTVMPGAYPWRNHPNAWRPAHIHFSLFGNSWASRLVTQMYFAGDPLLPLDPIFNSAPTERARQAMIAAYAHDVTEPEWALGWRWDIVLDGPRRDDRSRRGRPRRGSDPEGSRGSDPRA